MKCNVLKNTYNLRSVNVSLTGAGEIKINTELFNKSSAIGALEPESEMKVKLPNVAVDVRLTTNGMPIIGFIVSENKIVMLETY